MEIHKKTFVKRVHALSICKIHNSPGHGCVHGKSWVRVTETPGGDGIHGLTLPEMHRETVNQYESGCEDRRY